LLKLDRREEAEQLVAAFLSQLENDQQMSDLDSKTLREAGRFKHILGQVDGATEAYSTSLHLDIKRLETAKDADERAQIHFSIGQTFFAMKQRKAADAEFLKALEITSDENLKRKIRIWIQYWERFESRADLLPDKLSTISPSTPGTITP
jgi:tetratricopeptide (TPR) repeat protein